MNNQYLKTKNYFKNLKKNIFLKVKKVVQLSQSKSKSEQVRVQSPSQESKSSSSLSPSLSLNSKL